MFFDSLKVVKNWFPSNIRPAENYDLFPVEKIGELTVLYAPLFGKVAVYDDEFRNSFSTPEGFERILVSKLGECYRPAIPNTKFKDFNILPTSACNLRCVYCYAHGGDVRRDLDFKIVKKAVKVVNENSDDKMAVLFHGGGEPTVNFKLLKKIKEYVDKELSAEKTFMIQTNGVFSKEVREWILKNIDLIRISCDGPPPIQDAQRPMRDGGRSSPIVEENIKYFIKNSADVAVTAVISKFSNDKQLEILDYFNELGVKKLKFAPVEKMGRCFSERSEYSASPEIMRAFTGNLMKCMELAEMYGIDFVCKGLIESWTDVSCYATGRAFTLTPDGFVSSCPIFYSAESEFKEFVFGYFDRKEKEIKIDKEKLAFLQRRTVESIPACQNCFIKWNCAGACMASACLMHGRDIYSPYEGHCRWLRKIGRETLLYKVRKNLLKLDPFLEERNGRIFYRGVFNKFELAKFPSNKSRTAMLEVDVDNADFTTLSEEIMKNKPRLLLITFKISKKNLNSNVGGCIENFLKLLKSQHINFFVAKPLPRCLFTSNSTNFQELRIPKNCEECMWLYVMKDGYFHICNTELRIPKNKVRTRKEIAELFKKYGKKPSNDLCDGCVYKIRGNCDGLCQRSVF